jgi:LAO/AO transport system kinase
MLALGQREDDGVPEGGWKPPIVSTVAPSGRGFDELAEVIEAHREWLVENDQLEVRRRRRAREEIEAVAVASLRSRWEGIRGHQGLDELAAEVVAGRTDPYSAADRLVGPSDS